MTNDNRRQFATHFCGFRRGNSVQTGECKGNIDEFFADLAADPILKDGLTYAVHIRADAVSRMRVPAWRNQAVLDHH